MEDKDDLISRRAVLDIVAKDSGMAGTHDQIEPLPGQMTAAEAWEIAKEIVCSPIYGYLHYKDLKKIFGSGFSEDILRRLTPEEAKAKIEAWENRLKVGDVVEFADGDKAVVTSIDTISGEYHFLLSSGDTCPGSSDYLRKTGKTIDIQSILDQLGA